MNVPFPPPFFLCMWLELEKPVGSFPPLSFPEEERYIFKGRNYSFFMLLKITITTHMEEEHIQYIVQKNFLEVIMLEEMVEVLVKIVEVALMVFMMR